MKKILLLLLFVFILPLVSAEYNFPYIYDNLGEYNDNSNFQECAYEESPFQAYKFVQMYPFECMIEPYKASNYRLSVSLDFLDYENAVFSQTDVIERDLCGRNIDSYSVLNNYTFGECEYKIDEYPFYIYSYGIKCDKENPNWDWFSLSPGAERVSYDWESGSFTLQGYYYSSNTIQLQDIYSCHYNPFASGTVATQQVQITYVSNPNYKGLWHPYEYLRFKDELGLDYVYYPDFSDDSCDIQATETGYQVICKEIYEMEVVQNLPLGENDTSNGYEIEINTTKPDNNTAGMINTPADKPSEDDMTGGNSNIGDTPDGEGVRKQLYFDNLQSNIKKKNVFMNYWILIAEVTFSFVLLLFYLFELAVTGFVLTEWIPAVINIPIKIIRYITGRSQ